ncbi:MAG: lipase [Cyanobacteria bacterium P01_H01_bin.15]
MPLPTVILPGFFASASSYRGLKRALNQAGVPATIVPLTAWDWVPTVGGRSVSSILERLAQTVDNMLLTYQVPQVTLLGHSAGGWISRIYLGDRPYDIHSSASAKRAIWSGHQKVQTLLTLGTPHISQERWTRRNLDFVNSCYPGAFYADVRYLCLAGKALYGQRTWQNWFAYNSYQLTVGTGRCWGDGIVPLAAAHLDGAENHVLEQAWHSPSSPGPWYGSPQIVEQWINFLRE